MKKICLALLVMGLSIFLMIGKALAIPLPEALGSFTIGALTDFGVPLLASPLIVQFEDPASPNIHDLVASTSYYDATDGVFTYLYQVYANGPATTMRFSIDPFIGLTNKTVGSTTARMGYVSSTAFTLLPAVYNGWTIESPSIIPNAGDYDLTTSTAGFSFGTTGNQIIPDSTSHILVVASIYEPSLIKGNVINGGVVRDSVVGPIPEPGSMLLLGMGILGLFGITRRKA